MSTKRQKTARERDDFCDFNEFWCGISMVLCVNKSNGLCAVVWEMSIFNRDIMTEWYHRINKATVWPYAIFSHSRSIHNHLLCHIFPAQCHYLRNHIQQTVGTNQKELIKRAMFVCMRSDNHAFATVVCPILLIFRHSVIPPNTCVASSPLWCQQFVFLLNFLFSLWLFFWCFLPIVSCLV